MKKYILVLILSLILLTSCVNNNQEEVKTPNVQELIRKECEFLRQNK